MEWLRMRWTTKVFRDLRQGWRRGLRGSRSLVFYYGHRGHGKPSLGHSCLTAILSSAILLFICEFLIYYIVIFQCSWPNEMVGVYAGAETVKAMIFSDPHLLGPFRGHWFDKLRREWQMHRSFQTAMQLFKPEYVFILGDVFDEGQWVSNKDFDGYVHRFKSVFPVPNETVLYIVAGNHDVGFHYHMKSHPDLSDRFNRALGSSGVRLIQIKGNNFVLVNSMAMEQDGCSICKTALKELQSIAERLKCQKYPLDANKCSKHRKIIGPYTRPILLQHFPLYRESDELCSGADSAPEYEKKKKFRQNWECLSKTSTKLLLNILEPRLVMSGHTHHGCLVQHQNPNINDSSRSRDTEATLIPEYSVPSFSWRNRNNPSFFLGHFTKGSYKLQKCPMPQESTVVQFYVLGFSLIGLVFIKNIFLIIKYSYIPLQSQL